MVTALTAALPIKTLVVSWVWLGSRSVGFTIQSKPDVSSDSSKLVRGWPCLLWRSIKPWIVNAHAKYSPAMLVFMSAQLQQRGSQGWVFESRDKIGRSGSGQGEG